MNKTFQELKKWLFNIEGSRYSQIMNYSIIIVLVTFMKILLIFQIYGDGFTSPFEICVWAFMIIWLALRALHSFNLLEGYYQFAAILPMLYVLMFTTGITLINISIAIVMACNIFEIISIFVKGRVSE